MRVLDDGTSIMSETSDCEAQAGTFRTVWETIRVRREKVEDRQNFANRRGELPVLFGAREGACRSIPQQLEQGVFVPLLPTE